jgi:hypothetical protein
VSLFVSATIQLRGMAEGEREREREREMTRGGCGHGVSGGHSGILKTAGVCVYVVRITWD